METPYQKLMKDINGANRKYSDHITNMMVRHAEEAQDGSSEEIERLKSNQSS